MYKYIKNTHCSIKMIVICKFFVFLIFCTNHSTCKIRKELRLDRIEDCYDGNQSSLFRAEYITMSYNDNGAYFNAKGEVLRDLKNNKLGIQVRIQRCANKEALDSCEYFATLKPPNVCFLINARGVAWESMFGNIEPPFRCPIKKNVYIAKNGRFDPNLFNSFPLEGYYWKVNVKIYEASTYIGAYCLDGAIVLKHY